ncbi:MAG TPA: LCP family protein, partial [Dehalococcoidia bacterium]|nr:LCP family protein [Dehalococcoidia bacterium]
MVLGIIALAGGAFYTALIVATQVDHVFFPGKEIKLGRTLSALPGIQSGDTAVANAADPTGRRINVLVMGIDTRDVTGSSQNTDTMFVMSIDPVTQTARGLAMPRDLWVPIELGNGKSAGKERINTAYATGGVDAAEATVENLLGVNIDYYVLIDFDGFKQIVNLLGGVDVHVPDGLGVDDPYYSETEAPGDYYPCEFPPGDYHMDGSQALCYARVRRNSDDRERIIRQQTVIYAVIDKAAQLDLLSSPKNLINLWKRYKDTVKTDISDLQIAGFADLAVHIDRNKLAIQSLGAVTTPYTIPDTGAQVLLPSDAGIKEMVTAFLSDSKLQDEAATVGIVDGTGVDGQASKAQDLFASLGIPQASLTENTASAPTPTTQIIDFTGKTYTASRLAGALNLQADHIRNATPADDALRANNEDVVVVLGEDAKLDTALGAP